MPETLKTEPTAFDELRPIPPAQEAATDKALRVRGLGGAPLEAGHDWVKAQFVSVQSESPQTDDLAKTDPIVRERLLSADWKVSPPPPTHEEDPLLSMSEVGRQLGKSPQTIGRWCQEGLLEYVRQPSGLIAIRQSVVNRFLGGTALGK